MKVPMPTYRSPLGRFVPDSINTEQIKREGWRGQGIVVIAVDDVRLDWMERELLKQIGERLYGRREHAHG